MIRNLPQRVGRIRRGEGGPLGIAVEVLGSAADFGEWRLAVRLFGGLPEAVVVRSYRALNEVGLNTDMTMEQRSGFLAAIDALFASAATSHADDVRRQLTESREQRDQERTRRQL